MQLDWIETFLDLSQTLSFNQTAERLGVTQSTISARIKGLERTLGVKLFERSRSGTRLTTEGLRFEPHARSLRHDWILARHATQDTAATGVTMRIGLQHDLATYDIKSVIDRFRRVLPDTAFFFEADYSDQMCNDLVSGRQDMSILFSPKYHPDIHFQPVGEVGYVMVSDRAETLTAVDVDNYILANYSASFAQLHASLLPQLSQAPLSIGQNAAMIELLTSLGGSAYVLRRTARGLVDGGQFNIVQGAPHLSQQVFIGVHIRRRHRASIRRLAGTLQDHYGIGVLPRQTKRSV